MIPSLKSFVRRGVNKAGYNLVKRPRFALDEYPVFSHPLEATYGKHEDDLIILRADLWRFSNYTGQTYGAEGWHPFVAALLEFKNSNQAYEDSVLHEYYNTWQPENAQEAFITFSGAPEAFAGRPSFGFVSPWHCISLEERVRAMRGNVASENRDAGNEDIGIEEGFSLHGPASLKKGQLEYRRLVKTYQSIQCRGYCVTSSEDLITGFSLVDESSGNFRIIVVHGNHRLAALSALEYRTAPVRLVAPFVVRRNDVPYWPQVRNGTWTSQKAKLYFDAMLDAHNQMREWAANYDFPSY